VSSLWFKNSNTVPVGKGHIGDVAYLVYPRTVGDPVEVTAAVPIGVIAGVGDDLVLVMEASDRPEFGLLSMVDLKRTLGEHDVAWRIRCMVGECRDAAYNAAAPGVVREEAIRNISDAVRAWVWRLLMSVDLAASVRAIDVWDDPEMQRLDVELRFELSDDVSDYVLHVAVPWDRVVESDACCYPAKSQSTPPWPDAWPVTWTNPDSPGDVVRFEVRVPEGALPADAACAAPGERDAAEAWVRDLGASLCEREGQRIRRLCAWPMCPTCGSTVELRWYREDAPAANVTWRPWWVCPSHTEKGGAA
jgi:hypothetical protein